MEKLNKPRRKRASAEMNNSDLHLQCPTCSSPTMVKIGYSRYGKQRWLCTACGKKTTKQMLRPSLLTSTSKTCPCCGLAFSLLTSPYNHHWTEPNNPIQQNKYICQSCNSILTQRIWGSLQSYIGNHVLPSFTLQCVYIQLMRKPTSPLCKDIWEKLLRFSYPDLFTNTNEPTEQPIPEIITEPPKPKCSPIPLTHSNMDICCPQCDSNHINKFGSLPTKTMGHKQRYRCFDCGSTFYSPNPYHRNRGG